MCSLRFIFCLILLGFGSFDAHAWIPGGTETSLFPGVIYLNENCTATFIQDRVLLTAAHCTNPDPAARHLKPNGYHTDITINKISTGATIYFRSQEINPYSKKEFGDAFTKSLNEVDLGFDLALIILDQSFDTVPVAVAERAPEKGSLVELIGYGGFDYRNDRYIGPGKKRMGTNQIFDTSTQGILIRGRVHSKSLDTFDQNATLPGDSGGPLMNAEGEIIGILSGWLLFYGKHSPSQYSVPDLKEFEEISYYQRVDGADVHEWIRGVIEHSSAPAP